MEACYDLLEISLAMELLTDILIYASLVLLSRLIVACGRFQPIQPDVWDF